MVYEAYEVYDDEDNGNYSPGKVDWPERKIEPRKEKYPDFTRISEEERIRICNEFLNESKFDKIYGPDSEGWYREYGFIGYDQDHPRALKTVHGTLPKNGLSAGPRFRWVEGRLHDEDGNPTTSFRGPSTNIRESWSAWYLSGLRRYHTHVDEPDHIRDWSQHGHSHTDIENFNYSDKRWQISGVFDGDNKTYYQMDRRGNMTSISFLAMWDTLNCDELAE